MACTSIYLDHNSTTPIDPRVVAAMAQAWKDCGANPASQHSLGRQARRMLEEAREGILELLGAKTGGMDADQLVFTSGGTEANNLALFGLTAHRSGTLTISDIEHPSIVVAAQELGRRGLDVRIIPALKAGTILGGPLPKSLPFPRLVSAMLAN